MAASQKDPWYTWYESFDKTHSPAQRREWYSQAAQAYNWARPRYPQALVDRVVAQTKLKPGSSLLEIGCGPGIATMAFAAKGLTVQAVEPSPAACEVARHNCRHYPQVNIANSTFEDWPLASAKYDAVLAATSFHWVSPAVACQKSAAALVPGGSLILLWATPPQLSREICDSLQPIFERFDLSALGKEQHRTQTYYEDNFQMFVEMVNQSGYFQSANLEVETCQSLYTADKYIALLSTLSGFIRLAASTRAGLLAALGERLTAEFGSAEMITTHWFASQVSPLKTTIAASE